jgi:uncharacterized membrane protein YidH (DUF202 family)
VIGLVVVVIGVALLVGGALGALGSLSINRTFTEPHPGEFVSVEIKLNTTSDLVVTSPAALGGIVHAQDLNAVNSTNIGTYALSVSSSDIYRGLPAGDYYYVVFASTEPSTTIVATNLHSGVVVFGILALSGIVILIVGGIVAIVGVVQKKKQPRQMEQQR